MRANEPPDQSRAVGAFTLRLLQPVVSHLTGGGGRRVCISAAFGRPNWPAGAYGWPAGRLVGGPAGCWLEWRPQTVMRAAEPTAKVQ